MRARELLLAEVALNENDRREFNYPWNRRTSMLRENNLSVYAPYEIIEDNGEKFIVATFYKDKFNKEFYEIEDKDDKLNILLDCVNKQSHQISPFQVENSFLEAYKINLDDEESILSFCNRFGVLGELIQKNTFNEVFLDFMDLGWPFESLDFFQNEIKSFKECFDLYIMTEIDDEKKLGERWKDLLQRDIKETTQGLLKMKNNNALDQHLEAYYRALKDFEQFKSKTEYQIQNLPSKEEILKDVKIRLMDKVNERLPNVFSTLKMTPNGDLVEGITSFNLLGAVYYQLYQHIVEGSKFQECKHCGNYFGPLRKSDMVFCPNEPGDTSKRSRHENSYNSMVKRARKWAKEGLTAEQIQNKIRTPKKRSLKEIKAWIEEK